LWFLQSIIVMDGEKQEKGWDFFRLARRWPEPPEVKGFYPVDQCQLGARRLQLSKKWTTRSIFFTTFWLGKFGIQSNSETKNRILSMLFRAS
jgi:hypothetical protein